MLMEEQERVTDPVKQSEYSRLLSAVIQQVIFILLLHSFQFMSKIRSMKNSTV